MPKKKVTGAHTRTHSCSADPVSDLSASFLLPPPPSSPAMSRTPTPRRATRAGNENHARRGSPGRPAEKRNQPRELASWQQRRSAAGPGTIVIVVVVVVGCIEAKQSKAKQKNRHGPTGKTDRQTDRQGTRKQQSGLCLLITSCQVYSLSCPSPASQPAMRCSPPVIGTSISIPIPVPVCARRTPVQRESACIPDQTTDYSAGTQERRRGAREGGI